MPVPTIDRPVSALRQRMLEDTAMRGLRSDTQHEYIRFVPASQPSCGNRPIRLRLRIFAGFRFTSERVGYNPGGFRTRPRAQTRGLRWQASENLHQKADTRRRRQQCPPIRQRRH